MDSFAINRALHAVRNTSSNRQQVIKLALERLGREVAVGDAALERMIAFRKSNLDVIEEACLSTEMQAKAELKKLLGKKAAAYK